MSGAGKFINQCTRWMLLLLFLIGHGLAWAADPADQPQFLNTDPQVKYLGDEVCQSCHPTLYQGFKQTGMGQSMAIPSAGDPLGDFAKEAEVAGPEPGHVYRSYARDGKYFHEMAQTGGAGREAYSQAYEVLYGVGSGRTGRSYLIGRDGFLYMSPLSYYTSVGNWDISPGQAEGLYRGFERPAMLQCVGCHSGYPKTAPGPSHRYAQPAFESIEYLSIGCERCHGPGALHVEQRMAGQEIPAGFDPTVVNPAKLSPALRDDVCNQCHLIGDIRVLQPGRDDLSFRPGTPLDGTVSMFSLPPNMKPSGMQAVDQVNQMKMSRCWQQSNGQMGCITCHDPHKWQHGPEAAADFRSRCMTCHENAGCALPMEGRQDTNPPNNCVQCHMPSGGVSDVAHVARTNHGIPRDTARELEMLFAGNLAPETELKWETKVTGQEEPGLRALAIAHATAAGGLQFFRHRAIELMEQAAKAFPDDAEVQTQFGRLLHIADPARKEEAVSALERGLSLGSTSLEAREVLAGIYRAQGNTDRAVELYQEAIEFDPYESSVYLGLAQTYLGLDQNEEARKLIEKVRSFDPSNPALRQFERR